MMFHKWSENSSRTWKYFLFILPVAVIFIIVYQLNARPSTLFRIIYNNDRSSLYNVSALHSKILSKILPPTRTLVVYVYAKTHELAEQNLAFFIHNAVHASHDADYYFILQNLDNIPVDERRLPLLPSNAHYIQHANLCFDIGTVGWFLLSGLVDIVKYKYFIFLNSSVRGPYIVSYYDNTVWYTIFTNRLNDQIKLVGCTINCEYFPHVQSYLWVLDYDALDLLIRNNTVFNCYDNQGATIFYSEIFASRVIVDSGFGIASLMKKYQETDFRLEKNHQCNNSTNPTFLGVDQISSGPFEVVFVKIKDQFTEYQNNRDRVATYEKWIH